MWLLIGHVGVIGEEVLRGVEVFMHLSKSGLEPKIWGHGARVARFLRPCQ